MLPWSPRCRNFIFCEKSSYSGETGLFISILRNTIEHLPKNKAIRYIWSTNGNWIVTFSGFGNPRLNFPVSLKIGMDWTIQTAESRKSPSLPSTDKIYNYPAHTNYFSIVPSYLPVLINDSNFEGVEHAVGWEAPGWGGAAVSLPGETLFSHTAAAPGPVPAGFAIQKYPQQWNRHSPPPARHWAMPKATPGSQTWVCNTGISPCLSSAVIYKIIPRPGSWCEPRPGWASQAQQTKLWVSGGKWALASCAACSCSICSCNLLLPLLPPPERESFLQKEDFFSHPIKNNIWFSVEDKMLIFGSPQSKSVVLFYYFKSSCQKRDWVICPASNSLFSKLCFKEIPSAKPPKG